MKKTFVKPTLKSYSLNKKESIVASITWNDGQMSMKWNFHQMNPETNLPEFTDEQGCFDVLDNAFPTTVNGVSTIATEGTWDGFVSRLSRYDDKLSPDYHQESALNDWTLYQGCRTI